MKDLLRRIQKDRVLLLACVVLALIVGGSLALRLSVTLGYWLPLGRDGPYNFFHSNYLLDHYPHMHSREVPGFFHFAAWVMGALSVLGVSRITAFDIATALASGLVAITTFLMMRRLTKNSWIALMAAFLSAFLPANLRLMGELQKNAFGVTLMPLSVLFFWRSLESESKLDMIVTGILLGVVGLTHQLAFGTLAIAYVTYLGVLMAYRKRIPWKEIRIVAIIGVVAALICGWYYYGAISGAESLAGESGPAPAQEGPAIYRFYDEYMGRMLLFFSLVGLGVGILRRRKSDLFLIAWWLSALAMAQPWVSSEYQWRFAIMLGMPTALLAAVGIIDGIGGLLESKPFARIGKSHSHLVQKGILGGVVIFVVLVQTCSAHYYAWNGEMLQPLITMEEYEALVEFKENFGEVPVFGTGEGIGLYWPDAVGLLGTIQAGEITRSLSEMLKCPGVTALELATEWYQKEQEAGNTIYAITRPSEATILEDQQYFVRVFEKNGLVAYSLSDNFIPPASAYTSHQLYGEPLPPAEPGEPTILHVLLFPIYLLQGGLRFIIGVPLTVFIWVLAFSLGAEVLRKFLSPAAMKQARLGVVALLLIAGLVFLTTLPNSGEKGGAPPPGEMPPPEAPPPPEGAPFLLTARSADGIHWTKDLQAIAYDASVPDAVFDGENVRVYYSKWEGGLGVLVSKDLIHWTEKEVSISGLPEGHGAVDPDVVILPDGRYRMYYYEPSSIVGDPALLPGPHVIASAISDDGYTFVRESGERYSQEGITDPEVIRTNGEWRMFCCTSGEVLISAVSYDNGLSFASGNELPVKGVAPCAVAVDGGYRMYYHRGGDRPAIYSAFSPDGITWTKEGVCLEAGSKGEPDEAGVEAPTVVQLSSGEYLMVYQTRKITE